MEPKKNSPVTDKSKVVDTQPKPLEPARESSLDNFAAPKNAPQAVERTVVVEKQAGGGCFKWFTIGCILLVVLSCCALCILLLAAPSALAGIAASTTKGRDESLARVGSTDYSTIKSDVDAKNQVRDNEINLNPNGETTVTYSEKEVAYILLDSLDLQAYPDEVGVELADNYMKLEFGIEALLKKAEKEEKLDASNTSWAKDLYFSVELSTSQNGEKLEVDKISTGNSFLDKLIPQNLTVDMEEELNRSFKSGDATLKRVEFKQDQLVLVYTD